MIGAAATLLCCSLVAAGGLRVPVLSGLRGRSLSFPALRPAFQDIARVTWSTQGTHLAEAKPREEKFSVDYLPDFRGRLLIHPSNLSLEIRLLRLEDSGTYEVVVDTLSEPTTPKTFQYLLLVRGDSSGPTTGDGSTVTPVGVTQPGVGDPTTPGTEWEQPHEGCGAWGHYCVLKGYLVAAVLGPLLVLVVTIHLMSRDEATPPEDGISSRV